MAIKDFVRVPYWLYSSYFVEPSCTCSFVYAQRFVTICKREVSVTAGCFLFPLQLEVDFAIGRDITPETVNRVTEVLQEW